MIRNVHGIVLFLLCIVLAGCQGKKDETLSPTPKSAIEAPGRVCWEVIGQQGFSKETANYISLAIENGVPYAAYQDSYYSNSLTVMKYEENKWAPLGEEGRLPAPAL